MFFLTNQQVNLSWFIYLFVFLLLHVALFTYSSIEAFLSLLSFQMNGRWVAQPPAPTTVFYCKWKIREFLKRVVLENAFEGTKIETNPESEHGG